MAARHTIFTTIRTEGALLPADLLQRISEGANLDGLTPESYHRPGEKLNEVINRSWNALQGAWASFRAAQERLPEDDLGTSITRERWLLPLFRELDYGRLQTTTAVEIDGRSYPISHGWEHVPIHLVSYKLELDRRTPGAAGAASASPHSLLQVFLNRSENNLWGFLSNGYRLRILRDNASLTRQAYVEFDLEAMMEGEVYSDFVLLWLLCHQSRVEGERPSDCWLEKWMKVAQDQGTRALDQLRDGVEQAIEALGLGFLEHHANAALRDKLTSGELNAQEYYRQLLRMVYRLLFLFVAEDRELLLNPEAPPDARDRYSRYYSTQRLRRMAETFKGTRHSDLFESLRLVMRLLSGDDSPRPAGEGPGVRVSAGAGLGLVPLGSFLFSDRAVADIIDCHIANSHLLDAVRALSLTYDQRAQVYRTVDYRNLGSDELGSIFESLLELHPQINVPARRFALSTAAGNERKTTGSYYTPESLVHALLDSALDPVLEEAIKGGKVAIQPPSPTLPPHEEGSKERVRAMATKAMRDIPRNLRQKQTPAETILWEALRNNRLGGLGFRRQHPVANTTYVVDFFCYSANLIVELDGEIHQFQRAEDAQRQADLEQRGYRFIRFPNRRVINDLENVLIEILTAAQEKVPPPEGEGFRAATAEERILNLKVCDPACGSGHFLIAAANRMAKALAFVRTGEEEPPPAAIQEAKRDIISHCIYGVDINPMAVELCKVNLWMEALEPGKPLSFLDHRIQVGNSLLGTTPRLMAGGIPDDAFNPIEGDDPKFAATTKKLNKQARKDRETGQRSMFELIDPPANYGYLKAAMHALDDTPDDTLEAVRRKEAQYTALASDPEYIKARLLADAWCAAFVWEKNAPKPPSPTLLHEEEGSPDSRAEKSPHLMGDLEGGHIPLPLTDLLYRRMEKNPLSENLRPMRESIVRLAQRYQFFHWHIAFPDVFSVPEDLQHAENQQTGWHGGFDVVLGNPPWEHTEIKEQEWFAERVPEIANAAGAKRKQLIDNLAQTEPYLYQVFVADKRAADGFSHFVRTSGSYPLTGRGRINTYPLFTEKTRHIINSDGRVGVIVPSGIATDDTTKFFFQDLMRTQSLASLYDFENREGLFPAVDSRMKFCLLTLRGSSPLALRERGFRGEGGQAEFAFFLHSVADLQDDWRRFTLSAQDIALLNPNTGTMATFRSVRDAEITKGIYRRVPVLIQEEPLENPWGISFKQGLFNMTSDSHLFRTRDELEREGYVLRGNQFVRGDERYLPLYEAKMMHQFTHRWATYESAPLHMGEGRGGEGLSTRDMTPDELRNPSALPMPRYWVDAREVAARLSSWGRGWLLGFRDITNTTNERTAIFGLIPRVAVGHKAPLAFIAFEPQWTPALAANADAFAFDYIARQKIGGTSLAFFYLKQLPVIPPHTYTPALLAFIVPRVLELTYTAWDLQPFAQDVGYGGPPFVWDEQRRFLMRCELDALYFHLYQINRDDVDYILETFPIVRRKDEAAHGEYRTKRVILEMYDQMAALPVMHAPAPKSPPRHEGEGDIGDEGLVAVPDVSQWQTWLKPPPADERVAYRE